MLYRLSAAAIIGFWLLMGTLLVRTEMFPDQRDRLPVPIDYIGHLIFRHEQASDLLLFAQKRRLDGNFHVQPKRLLLSADGTPAAGNLLSVSGNFPLNLPGLNGQRVVFHGSVELNQREEVRRLDISASLHEAKQNTPGVTLHVDGRPAENQWRYQITQGGTTLREGSGTPEEILEKSDLRGFGLDSRLFSRVAPQSAATTLSAHRGVLRVNDEDIEAFVVTIHQGDGMDTAVYVNQLGQILAAKTFLGYDLYDETLVP